MKVLTSKIVNGKKMFLIEDNNPQGKVFAQDGKPIKKENISNYNPYYVDVRGLNASESTKTNLTPTTKITSQEIKKIKESPTNVGNIKIKEAQEKAQRLKEAEEAYKKRKTGAPITPELLAQETQAIGDKISLQNIPGVGQYIPDILDVTGGIGSMASNLGALPLNLNRGNYGQALLSVAAPLATGALAGASSPTMGQFVNNVANPLAGTGDLINNLGNKYLPNAYKLNPKALKEVQEQMLVRARPVGQDPYINMAEQLKAKQAAGEQLTWYQKNLLNPQTNPQMAAREKYFGQWFADNPSDLDFYINPGTRNFADDAQIEILKARMPKSEAAKYNVKNFEDAKSLSNLHDTEYILPKDMVQQLERYSVDDLSKLIKEYNEINKPHWLKGYKKVPDSKAKFQSEIDWAKWNKEIPENITLTQTSSQPKQWQLEELPGLHLKSTMEGEAISKIVEPKTGLVNVEQALAIIGKESGGADKVALIKQGLGNNIPKKMDYNEFRKTVQDQLIPLEKQFSTHASDYGINRLGYNTPKMGGFNNRYVIKEAEAPLENQTLILGNKGKFGRGSSAHGNPDETLGHIHFLRDAETPDILTVTQIQSDAFQGTHRIMPKDSKNLTALEKQQKSLARMEELQERNKSILHKMKTEGLDEAGLPVQDYQIKQFEDIVKAQEQSNLFKKADIENFTQKQLLDKNHQERYLQELVDYAGKRGDVNKIRVPTSETAAKVQGYKPVTTAEELIEEHNKLKGTPEWNKIMSNTPDADKVRLQKVLEGKIKGDIYDLERTTILKKYAEQPKTIKKLFGQEPKIVTDKKGNTWYEFDIPKKFKEGKGEIKAFGLAPIGIGLGVGASMQNKEYKNGGVIGNNGMFDMTNPNIYKSIVGALATGTLGKQAMQKKEFGGKILDTRIVNGQKQYLINE